LYFILINNKKHKYSYIDYHIYTHIYIHIHTSIYKYHTHTHTHIHTYKSHNHIWVGHACLWCLVIIIIVQSKSHIYGNLTLHWIPPVLGIRSNIYGFVSIVIMLAKSGTTELFSAWHDALPKFLHVPPLIQSHFTITYIF
jgi:hypothetical protein